MNYSVIRAFFDVQDGEYGYHVGDVFPREGYAPSQERLDSLLSANNAGHQPFIVEVDENVEEVNAEVTEATQEVTDLKDLTNPELAKLAEEKGLEAPKKATKAQLLELLGE